MQVTQLNLNHCETAQSLLQRSVYENKTDVALLPDPYCISAGNGSWIADKPRTVSIWICGKYPIQGIVLSPDREGSVIAEVNGVNFVALLLSS